MKFTFKIILPVIVTALILSSRIISAGEVAYPVVDTGQDKCYGNSGEIACPDAEKTFYGQDARYRENSPAYRDNSDGTVTDLVTGLMWQKGTGEKKVTLEEAQEMAKTMNLAGYTDWRVPTIKELYSLIDFRGSTGTVRGVRGNNGPPHGGISPETRLPGGTGNTGRGNFKREAPANAVPYINTDYFDFTYGNVGDGERYIDAQWLSCTEYVSTTMNGMDTLFGVNFADGRIKGYGYRMHGTTRIVKKFFVRFVRGASYGENLFVDNGDGTITDKATGLAWMQADSGRAVNWQEALEYAEKLNYAGHDDWRLPNAKELQSIVDYSRSPDTTGSAAINPLFQTTTITNEAGQKDYPFFWSSTTHLDGIRPGSMAAYVAFGRAIGEMNGRVMDVHGAGAQRSDPKTGRATLGRGPQGDAQRVLNFVRCVRGGTATTIKSDMGSSAGAANKYPAKVTISDNLPGDPALALRLKEASQMDRGPGAMGPIGFVRRLDKDGDGRVSRAEFDGPADRFDFHDANHDGYLTDEEAPGPGKRRQ